MNESEKLGEPNTCLKYLNYLNGCLLVVIVFVNNTITVFTRLTSSRFILFRLTSSKIFYLQL